MKSSKRAQKTINLKKAKLEYWARQPIPVFIFLVGTVGNDLSAIDVNIINLTEQFTLASSFQGASKTFRFDQRIDSLKSLEAFINHNVPHTIARQWLPHGMIVASKPGVTLGYFRHYPSNGCRKFARDILKTIGRTASMLLKDILEHRNDWHANAQHRVLLEQILDCFRNYGNYDMHFYRGLSRIMNGNSPSAIAPLLKAIQCIEDDANVNQVVANPTKTFIRQVLAVAHAASGEEEKRLRVEQMLLLGGFFND